MTIAHNAILAGFSEFYIELWIKLKANDLPLTVYSNAEILNKGIRSGPIEWEIFRCNRDWDGVETGDATGMSVVGNGYSLGLFFPLLITDFNVYYHLAFQWNGGLTTSAISATKDNVSLNSTNPFESAEFTVIEGDIGDITIGNNPIGGGVGAAENDIAIIRIWDSIPSDETKLLLYNNDRVKFGK